MRLILNLALVAVWSSLVGPAWPGEICKPTQVPPWLEIEVLDPNAHPRGIPAIVPTDANHDGQMEIDIPQTILVHRYYYTGERSFQGPMIPGGPSIVVASHPKTGERCYVNVQMLPGAPRVTYRKDSIEYSYGHQVISVCFGMLGPKVVFRNGPGLGDRVGAVGTAVCNCAVNTVQNSSIPTHAAAICTKTKNVAHTTCDGVHAVAKGVTTPIRQIVQVLPFGKMLTSGDNGERHAEAVRERQVTAAQKQSVRLNASIPTLR